MSELSVKVAAEHWFTMNNGWHCVGCGYSDYVEANDHGYALAERRHVAAMTEAAVRETIAADIEALPNSPLCPTHYDVSSPNGATFMTGVAVGIEAARLITLGAP